MLHRLFSTQFMFGLLVTLFVINLNFINLAPLQHTLNRLEGMLYDLRLTLLLPAKTRQIDEKVLIIDIDEHSLQEQGRFPWSRIKIAELVEQLKRAGVVVIAFDVFFAEPEPNPVAQLLSKNANLPTDLHQQIVSLAPSVDADQSFAQSLQASDVVLGFLFDNSAKTKGVLPASIIDWQITQSQRSEIGKFDQVIGNIAQLQNEAAGAGFINSVPETDGFIRKASLVLNYQGKLYPSLALEAARVYTLSDNIKAITKDSQGMSWLQGLSFGKTLIPTNEHGQVLIPFKGAKRSFPYISATDVMNQRVDPEILEGSVVFIGTSAVGLADLRTTSVGVQYPGVEIHANVFESLLHPEILPVEPDTSLAILFGLLLATGTLLSFAMNKQGPMLILVLSLSMLSTHVLLNWSLWHYANVSLPLLQLVMLVLLLTLYYGIVGFMAESYKRKHIKGMFNQYVPPAYIDKLIRGGKGLSLKSERREMSVLFADVRDFTSIAEQFSPEQLSDFMHQYLTEVTAAIFEHQGTIDKYVGDMVMAFWNAPLDDELHACHAVQSALAMIAVCNELTIKYQQQGWPAIHIGVGVSTGEMVVGDMGSSYRKAYTVLGDAVNLGSRIESLTKYYQVPILISEQTQLIVAEHGIVCRQIDKIRVKGKQQGILIYQPLMLSSELNSELEQALQLHAQAMQCYYAQQWPDAINLFNQLISYAYFSVQIYATFLNRIAEFQQNGVPAQWDGIYSHDTK